MEVTREERLPMPKVESFWYDEENKVWKPRMVDSEGRTVVHAPNIIEEKELGVIDYTEFSAGGTVSRFFLKSLNRSAKKRVIVLFSTLDINMSSQRITMSDSLFSNTSRTAGSTATTTNILANNGCTQVIDSTSAQITGGFAGIIDMPVDSFSISFTVGATAPIKGEVKIGIIEVL